MKLPQIALYPPREYSRCKSVLSAFEALYDVLFVPAMRDSLGAHQFAWLVDPSREEAMNLVRGGTRVLGFARGDRRVTLSPGARVQISDAGSIPGCFRGQAVDDASISEVGWLEILPDDEILARKGDVPLWVRQVEAEGSLEISALPLPQLAAGDFLHDFFHHGRWAGLLPMLHFLKKASPWTPPPVRACFMFDDPNLHWKNYGYADYREVARQGGEHHYHASFATVPFDGWYVNRTAASIFRQHQERLSLLIHGNNHTSCELARTQGDESCRILAAQAIQRIGKLEKKAGIAVPRVMAAPHGACHHEMAGALLRAGFDAACISRGSVMARNPGLEWPVTIGLQVSEFMADGLPVIPRFNIRLDRGSEFSARLAAFLGQPVIPVGHHDDLGQGLGLLSRLADLVNSMGEVRWSDMNTIAETNFCTHRVGDSDLLHIKMFSRRIRLTVPGGVTQIHVVRPWLDDECGEGLELRIGDLVQEVPPGPGAAISVAPAQNIEIASIHPEAFDPARVAVPRTPFRALVRRHLCEVRDRLRPVKDRILPIKNSGRPVT